MDTIAFYLNFANANQTDSRQVRRGIRMRAENILELPDTQFIKLFRLNKAAFIYVLSELKNKLPPHVRSSSLTPECKLAAVLRFLAEGGYQTGAGQDFNVGMAQSTVSTTLSEVLNILEECLCPKWISLKMSEEEKMEAKMHFYERSGIPGIVMCVDGTHINILKPPGENTHLFYNRKGFYSLNAMIICDHKQRIRYVDARYPGASHDSFIWGNSEAFFYFKSLYDNGDRNIRLLGDSGYPLSPWLITPFRSAGVDTPKSRFNRSHSKGRNVVERTIGVWKNWCRCCLGARQLHYSPKKAVQIVNVSAALHNIRIHYNVCNEQLDNSEENDVFVHNDGEFTQTDSYSAEANQIRDEILRNFE